MMTMMAEFAEKILAILKVNWKGQSPTV